MTLKIAIAGAGHIANVHASAVKNQGGQVVAVIEKFLDKAAAFTQKFAIPHQYSTLEEAISEAKFDALVIGTPNFLHTPQTIAALNAKIPVMVEKPMAMNAVESAEVIEASLRSNTVLVVAHCWRFDEEVLWLRSQTHKLGKIIRTKGCGVHTHWGPGGWFLDKKLAGGGAIADVGIHAIDTARFLLNDPQPISVFAKIGTYYKNFDVDDTSIIIINWDNGTTSYIESGWWQPYVDSPLAGTQLYGTNGFGQIFPTRLILPCTQKQNEADRSIWNRVLSKFKKQEEIVEVKSGFNFPRKVHFPQSMYDRQMAHFFECIRTKLTPISGGIEGAINMQIVDAAYESAKTGQVVEITGITQ
ncbi:Gfo/Idh/MocA family protein [Pseudanabaena yagii]|uniref:Gfo/Idh/MocA family oxidoreductase n=1 Tax=Pseudanabaena yagii GIHE-NHR1 TaxID=2722753 RepID=A0ABX1M0L3_9CYAN|nr:Gfo/Idh/MocA family oxidoreductase [Pseudanabaena yagii]NMF60569.1 Gfo/Idh/MocA family oxidoreductase [Pseudanabaena yagii GIHE-NHR1]